MKVPDIKRLTSGYLLLAAYILPEQQTNLRINPDDAENLLIIFKMFDTPTDLWKLKKRAEPAFTSAKVRHASKPCSRGRFYAISYTLKKRAEPAFTFAKVRHASKFCSRGRFLRNFLYVKKSSQRQLCHWKLKFGYSLIL